MYIIIELYKNLKFYLWLCCENKIRESCSRINWTHFPLCFVYQLSFECLLSARHLEHEDWPLKFWTLIQKTSLEGFCPRLNHIGISPFPLKKKKKQQVGICYNWKVKGAVMPTYELDTYMTSLCPENHFFRASSWIILFLAVLGLSSACMCISYWFFIRVCLYVYMYIELECITGLLLDMQIVFKTWTCRSLSCLLLFQ